ncbi:MAG TPA: cobaltochelatase subunit CobN [Rhodocyclaceae bacterium]|nr:cobaltochelatase subunit CobN [Rhodocyclaceae bacterium]
MKRIFAGFALLSCSAFASAATLFGIVTDRAAPSVAAAAHAYQAEHPNDKLILRTPTQFMAASDKQVQAWLKQSDGVLAVAIFGDPARRLKGALQTTPVPRVFALNGEQTLSLMTRDAARNLNAVPGETLRDLSQEKPPTTALNAAAANPLLQEWLSMRQTWQAGGTRNLSNVVGRALRASAPLPQPRPEPSLRLRVGNDEWVDAEAWKGQHAPVGPSLVVVDLANADTEPADAVCAEAKRQGINCLTVLARWGSVSQDAMARLPQLIAPAKPVALVVLQDFVVGAAEGRESVTNALKQLNVPVFKAIRITERSVGQWRLSTDGLPADTVQYRLALPELQGSGQSIVIAAAGKPQLDKATGLEVRRPEMVDAEIGRLVARAKRWQVLQVKANRDKRVAIVYYNHPPGRQNIGADNLNVPESLFDMLQALKREGYNVGELPASPQALLDRIMADGVNLPEDKEALDHLAQHVNGVPQDEYARWFSTLPPRVQGEMTEGPLGRLHADVLEAERRSERAIGRARVSSVLKELDHLVAGADHPQRGKALDLLHKLEEGYLACLADSGKRKPCANMAATKNKLSALGIEGLRGWGKAPGKVMVARGRLLVPGLRFGNVFIAPQPPRGWEVDEELLHANTSVPPPHQYLAFYHWLRDDFKADVLVHVGRHSTYEFLPGKAAGLAGDDYPALIAGDLPGVYPYIVDGVGEGTQAKRRGLAVMVDHLTPPIASTPLYDQLLVLRQVVESYEASSSDTLRAQAAKTMREQVEALNLRKELEASMSDVLEVRGIGIEQADDDLLAHEIGHYLTKLQEKFMPYGLHVFGRPWSQENLALMLQSMKQGGIDDPAVTQRLKDSPKLEMAGLLTGLAGGFVPPGKGNDPLRSPEALPTGRNFHAVDGDILPTRIGYNLGNEMREKALARINPKKDTGSEGVILWASDAVRDEGVMVGFALSLLGAEPVWNPRGIVTDVKLVPNRKRRDVVVTTSGLFRDLYPNLLNLVDRGGRLALAASADTLLARDAALKPALDAALAAVPNAPRGNENLADNRVAERWLARTRTLQKQGMPIDEAGREAAWRIFGDAPGAYGTGVNRLTERSGAWRERDEIAEVYIKRMGHAYGLGGSAASGIAAGGGASIGGQPAHAALVLALGDVKRSYHGRASNLYGLLDNNDAFDYLGGMSLAVEHITGTPPEAMVLQHAEAGRADVEPLTTALLSEFRGRYLNPAWIKPMMAQGYSGARTMGQEFLENLWGWQVTRPDLVENWAWDEVKATYFDDKQKLGLNKFLSEGQNAHVKAHMLAIFMVAAEKGFWKTDAATIKQMGGELARLVTKNGLPGSGHTSPNNPMWAWLQPQLDSSDAAVLGATLSRARGEQLPASAYAASATSSSAPVTPSPVAAPAAPVPKEAVPDVQSAAKNDKRYYDVQPVESKITVSNVLLALLPIVVALFLFGLWRSRRAL